MARTLVPALDVLMTAERRLPDYRIEIFDIRSTKSAATPTRINDVVLANLNLAILPAIVGPRDFTDDTIAVSITDVAGDYAANGVAASNLQITLSDPDGEFDPVTNAPTTLDPTASGRWLRQGNVIVVREGDVQVPVVEWPITFTGALQGSPGQDFNRTTGNALLTAKANSREVDFLRQINTSRDFAQGSGFQDMAEEIAEIDMGLDTDEIDFATFGTSLTQFLSTQFVQESPLVTIAKIMFPDGFMPKFGGDGRLTLTTGSINKAPTVVYPNKELQVSLTRPLLEANGPNAIEILGLDPELDQIIQEFQELARASVTTGFFSRDVEIPVRWSEDKTQQALDARLEVLASIGDSIFAFGAEDFSDNPQSDGGSVEGTIEVEGALAQSIILAAIVAGAWIGTSFIPDAVAGNVTNPVGRPINAFVGKLLFSILGRAGKGEYRIMGRPYEYVFPEIRCVAQVLGLLSQDVEQLSIQNHLVNSEAVCDEVAERVLRRERAKQNTRSVNMIHDLRLEPDDVFSLGSGTDERRYMIQQISRTLQREGGIVAMMQCFETTVGVRP